MHCWWWCRCVHKRPIHEGISCQERPQALQQTTACGLLPRDLIQPSQFFEFLLPRETPLMSSQIIHCCQPLRNLHFSKKIWIYMDGLLCSHSAQCQHLISRITLSTNCCCCSSGYDCKLSSRRINFHSENVFSQGGQASYKDSMLNC